MPVNTGKGLLPIWQMTEEQWLKLPEATRGRYPPVLDGRCNPGHTNYFLCALHERVLHGEPVILDKLPPRYIQHLAWAASLVADERKAVSLEEQLRKFKEQLQWK